MGTNQVWKGIVSNFGSWLLGDSVVVSLLNYVWMKNVSTRYHQEHRTKKLHHDPLFIYYQLMIMIKDKGFNKSLIAFNINFVDMIDNYKFLL